MRVCVHSEMLLVTSTLLALLGLALVRADDWQLFMPGVLPDAHDLYLCKAFPISSFAAGTHYITRFAPKASQMTAHHMLLHGCDDPGNHGTGLDVWNCGEMRAGSDSFGKTGPVCRGEYSIIYAWAKDAPALDLPPDVSFKVGDKTKTKYLVLQVHYMMPMKEKDSSGLTATVTQTPTKRRAGVLLHATNGAIGPRTETNFDSACVVDEDVEIHPFGFRVHTHKLGNVVSGWRVRSSGESGQLEWALIGKQSPQLPQMFYPVHDPSLVIRKGDAIAARCNMYNFLNEPVYIGSTGDDEMCNFYTMYWVEGEQLVKDWQCASAGPPRYTWEYEAGLSNIPELDTVTLDQ